MYKNHEDRRIIKSKKAMREALIHLIEVKDFQKVTVTDIVEEADLNRGTFYKHYQTKEEILEELTEDILQDLVSSYRAPYKEQRAFKIDNLTTSTIKIFEHVKQYQNFYTLMLKADKLTGFQNKICEVLKNLSLNDLFENSVDTQQPNRELQASFFAYAILGMISEWAAHDFVYSTDYMADQLLIIIRNMKNSSIVRQKL